MIAARHHVYYWTGLAIGLTWLSTMLVDPDETIFLGYFLGMLSAHATMAATWSALGPGHILWRIPLSLAWVFMLLLAVAVNIAIHDGPSNGVSVVGVWMFVQWILMQMPMWMISAGMGFHLRFREDIDAAAVLSGTATEQTLRFGIRDLLITMAILGVLLGICRLLVSAISLPGMRELPIFIFLGVAGVVMTFPLVVASLMQRYALAGVAMALLFMAGATFGELMTSEMIGGPGPDIEDFISINIASAFGVLVIAGVVRLNGYSLRKSPRPTFAPVASDSTTDPDPVG